MAKKSSLSNRQKALDFAKNIPKPKIRAKAGEVGGTSDYYGDDNDTIAEGGADYYDADAYKLQELETKHMNSKKQIDAIRKQMGM